MNRYKQSLFDLIYKFVGEYHKAEDILQQVWLKLYLSLAIFHPNARIKPWLFTVARLRQGTRSSNRVGRGFVQTSLKM
jgi:DNA-directed RNA polymerase specialized sigma24 family protein